MGQTATHQDSAQLAAVLQRERFEYGPVHSDKLPLPLRGDEEKAKMSGENASIETHGRISHVDEEVHATSYGCDGFSQ